MSPLLVADIFYRKISVGSRLPGVPFHLLGAAFFIHIFFGNQFLTA
jgi:hypothetical protein